MDKKGCMWNTEWRRGKGTRPDEGQELGCECNTYSHQAVEAHLFLVSLVGIPTFLFFFSPHFCFLTHTCLWPLYFYMQDIMNVRVSCFTTSTSLNDIRVPKLQTRMRSYKTNRHGAHLPHLHDSSSTCFSELRAAPHWHVSTRQH